MALGQDRCFHILQVSTIGSDPTTSGQKPFFHGAEVIAGRSQSVIAFDINILRSDSQRLGVPGDNSHMLAPCSNLRRWQYDLGKDSLFASASPQICVRFIVPGPLTTTTCRYL